MFTLTRKHHIRGAIGTALLGATCAAALLPGSGQAASKTETLRFFDETTSLTLIRADGTKIPNPTVQPEPGDTLRIHTVDYVGNHKKHAKKPTASSVTTCVFGDTPEPSCTATVAIDGSLLLFDENNKVVEGTLRYEGATGAIVSNKTVDEETNASDVVLRIKRR